MKVKSRVGMRFDAKLKIDTLLFCVIPATARKKITNLSTQILEYLLI